MACAGILQTNKADREQVSSLCLVCSSQTQVSAQLHSESSACICWLQTNEAERVTAMGLDTRAPYEDVFVEEMSWWKIRHETAAESFTLHPPIHEQNNRLPLWSFTPKEKARVTCSNGVQCDGLVRRPLFHERHGPSLDQRCAAIALGSSSAGGVQQWGLIRWLGAETS